MIRSMLVKSYVRPQQPFQLAVKAVEFIKWNRTIEQFCHRRNMATQAAKMKDTTQILANLRALMQNLPNIGGAISAYIVPTDDVHQSEYINEADERRAYVSGFQGSCGTAVITADEALLWTDGRYYQQARKEMDDNWTLMKDGLTTTLSINDWLVKHLNAGDRVGVDGNLICYRLWSPWASALDAKGIQLLHIADNLVDAIWSDRPARTSNPVIALETSIAGRTIKQKLVDIRAQMLDKSCGLLVVTALDEVAWLFNLRGSDIKFNPVFFAYAIVTSDELHLFVDVSKLPSNYDDHFRANGATVVLHPYEAIQAIIAQKIDQIGDGKVWISSTSSYALTALVPSKQLVQDITPICLLKAIKNDVEAKGLVDCHIWDGVALCKYFAWLEATVQKGEHVDEISGATQLEEFRKKLPFFKGLSFPTISGSGSNGSIIHYDPKEDTKLPITINDMYLCDSGAQFLNGTTDVTRTWHFGTPTKHQIDCFTRVLKGQISLATTVFPNKVKGCFLDTFARRALWDVGLDYAHGTGHGIGHFLNVHEGPQGISSIRIRVDDPGLQVNMFVSNEPGYYEDGQFGIRIEDIVQIVPAQVQSDFAGRGALTFKTITMCPIQIKLIDATLLTEKERAYLNDYHKTVRETLTTLLLAEGDQFTAKWLAKETTPI